MTPERLAELRNWYSDPCARAVAGCVANTVRELVIELDRVRDIAAKYQADWQRLVTRLEEIPPSGLRVGRPVVDLDHVIRALDLDKPVPWVEEVEQRHCVCSYSTAKSRKTPPCDEWLDWPARRKRCYRCSHERACHRAALGVTDDGGSERE